MKKKIVVLLGPTSTGKSEMALKLVNEFPFEIVSADSMQFYKGMDIGTAKVSAAIREKYPHHFIDIIDVTQEFSIANYKKDFMELHKTIYEKGKIPLIVGGSGLYIRVITENFPVEKFVGKNGDLREYLNNLALDELRKIAFDCDPIQTQKIGYGDRKRLIRLIEYCKLANLRISDIKNEPPPFEFLKIGLMKDRAKLYEDTNSRVDKMIEKGLVDEVIRLKEQYKNWSKTARQAIGYKEILDYLDKKLTLEEAVELIKRHTRNLAKRQITWFKKEKDVVWFDVYNFEEAFNKIKILVESFLYEKD